MVNVYKIKIQIVKYILVYFILMLLSCTEMFYEKKFAIEGYENDISSLSNKKRNEKIVYEDRNIKIKYRCLTIYKKGKSESLLTIYKKVEDDIQIINFKWIHVYKNVKLENKYSGTDIIENNKVVPFKLFKKNKKIFYDFYSNNKAKDFSYGDKIEVIVELEYKICNEKNIINESFNIICQKREKTIEMP